MNILSNRFFFFIISIIYRLLLDYSYIKYVVEIFSGAGFKYHLTINSYLISWVITILLITVTPKKLSNPSDLFSSLGTYSLLFPMLTMYGLNSNLSVFAVLASVLSICAVQFIAKFKEIKAPAVPVFLNGEKYFYKISMLMVILLLIWLVASGGIFNFNLDLTKVYDFRKTNSEIINIGFFAYFNSWVMQIFSICLFSYGLWKKRYGLVAFALLCQIIFFGVSAHKAILFLPIIVLAFYVYLKNTDSLTTIPLLFSFVIFMSMLAFYFNEKSLLPNLFVRRNFFVPAYLSFIYFDFFSKNPFSFWTGSVFNPFMVDQYSQPITKVVGDWMGYEELNANNGYISSGYAQAGLFGVMIYTFILGVYLRWLNIFSRKVEYQWLVAALMLTPFRNLILASDLPTVFVTHGLIIATVMILFLRKK